MGKLHKNLSYDIKSGFMGNALYYIIWAIVFLFFVAIITSELRELHPEHFPSCADVISRFLLGVEKNNIFDRTEILQFPIEWFVIQMYILIGIARFPRQDLEECGYHVWIRTRSKLAWWTSKVIWCLIHVVVSYIICLLVILLAVFILNGRITFDISNLYHLNMQSASVMKMHYVHFVMPVLVTFAVGMMTMTVSFCFDGLMGLLAGIVTILASVFMDHPVLIGRYMMLYSYFSDKNTNRYSVWYGTVICVLIISVVSFAGYFLFRKREI